MANTVERPSSVKTVVWLIGLAALIDIVSAWALFILAGDVSTLAAHDLNSGQVMAAAYLLVITGVLTAVVGSLVGKGNNIVRLLVSVLMVLHVGGHVWQLVVGGNQSLASSIIGIAVAIAVLILLWNTESSAYFAAKEAAKEA